MVEVAHGTPPAESVQTPGTDVSGGVKTSTDSILCPVELLGEIIGEIKEEIKDRTGHDIEPLIPGGTPFENFVNRKDFCDDMYREFRDSVSNFLKKPISKLIGYFVQVDLTKFKVHPQKAKGNEGYILNVLCDGKNAKIAQSIVDQTNSLFNDVVLSAPPGVVSILSQLEKELRVFIDPEDSISLQLIAKDYNYSSTHKSEELIAPNVYEHYVEIFSAILARNSHLAQGVGGNTLKRGIKICYLCKIIINYLGARSGKNQNDSVLLSAFSYLRELQEEDKNDTLDTRPHSIAGHLFGRQISRSVYDKFNASRLKNDFLDTQKLPPHTSIFLASVALTHPNTFLDSESLEYENTFQLLSGANDPDRQKVLLGFFNNTDFPKDWKDGDIFAIIFLGIESLSFIYNLGSEDINWIFYHFCEVPEEGPAKIIKDINLLFNIRTYPEFLIMKALNSYDNAIEVAGWMLESQENFMHAMDYAEAVGDFREDLVYIPSCFIEIHKLADEVLAGEAYKGEIDYINSCIQTLKETTDFDAIVGFHKRIIEEYSQGSSDFRESILTGVFNLYPKMSDYPLQEQFDCIEKLLELGKHLGTMIAGKISGDNLSPFMSGDISMNQLIEFIHFLEKNDGWEDIETSFELFLEEYSGEPIEEKQDVSSQFNAIFNQRGPQIIQLGFPDSVRIKIIELSWHLKDWMIQILGEFLIEKRSEIHNTHREDEKKLIRNFGHLIRILGFMHDIGIHTIREPDKLYLHVLLGNCSRKSIDYMIDLFDENDIEIEEQYDETIRAIIRYLRDNNRDILFDFLGLKTREQEASDNPIVEEAVSTKRRNKGKRVLSSGVYSPIKATNYWDIFCKITEASFNGDAGFLSLSQSILSGEEKCDKEVYANLIIQSYTLGGNHGNEIIDTAIPFLKSAPGKISLSSMGELLKMFSDPKYSSGQAGSILNICKKYIGNSDFSRGGYAVANFIYSMSFLSQYGQSSDIIRALISNSNVLQMNFEKPIDIHHMLYGLFDYKEDETAKKLIKKLFSQVRKLGNLSNKRAESLMQVYSLYEENVPPNVATSFQKALSQRKKPHNGEKYVASIFRKYFSGTIIGGDIGGFECDLILSGDNANIELDGVDYHSGWDALKNERRDTYFRTKENPCDVYRIRTDRSIAKLAMEIVKEILRNKI